MESLLRCKNLAILLSTNTYNQPCQLFCRFAYFSCSSVRTHLCYTFNYEKQRSSDQPYIYIYICIHARAKNWTEQRETLIVLSVLFLVQSFSFRLVNEGRTRQFQFFFTYTWKCCTRFNGEATT